MKKNPVRLALFCALVLVFSANIAAAAKVNSTTAKKEEKIDRRAPKPCTKQDLLAIQKFDPKARRKVKQNARLAEEASEITTAEEAEDLQEDAQKILDFFTSDEYDAMRPVYKRCDKAIPTMNGGDRPFWEP